MTEQINIIKRYESFILGKCQCGCGEDIKIMNKGHNHLLRFKKGHGQKGERNSRYRGGHYENNGYDCIYRPHHKYAFGGGYVRTHRYIMELQLGRYLDPITEHVHHIDGNKKNNDLSNLMIVTNSQHQKITHEVDFSSYFCSECNSNKTQIEKNGKPHWYDDDNGGHLCRKCYKRKLRRNKK